MPQGFSPAQFDAVLFDVDGTLVDSLAMIVPGLRDVITKYAGVNPSDEDIRALIGLPIRAQLERYLPEAPSRDQLEEMTAYALSRYDAYLDGERVFESAVSALREMSARGMKIALVTSKNAQELSTFMTRFPGADAVDAAVCASDVQHPKPAPDAAILAISKLGAEPERTVMIGDSIYDLRCARAAGIANIAVGYGSASSHALLAEHPDLYLESPDALLAWALESFNNRHAPQETYPRRTLNPDDERTAGAA